MGSGCICIISNGEVNDLAFVNIAGISAQNKFVFTGFQTYKSSKSCRNNIRAGRYELRYIHELHEVVRR